MELLETRCVPSAVVDLPVASPEANLPAYFRYLVGKEAEMPAGFQMDTIQHVWTIEVNVNRPNVVFVVSNRDATAWVSTDAGETWSIFEPEPETKESNYPVTDEMLNAFSSIEQPVIETNVESVIASEEFTQPQLTNNLVAPQSEFEPLKVPVFQPTQYQSEFMVDFALIPKEGNVL